MTRTHTLKAVTSDKASAPSAAKVTKSVMMNHAKSTPGTHVYTVANPDDKGAVCTQVYLSKKSLGDKAPASITMTIEFTA